MVIKDMNTSWTGYSEKTGLSGILFDGANNYSMLFGKERGLLKMYKLMGCSSRVVATGMMFVVGPIRGHLCR